MNWFKLILFVVYSFISFQAEKAKDKEENEKLVDELDKNFTSLVESKALLSLTQPDKMNALKALVNKSTSSENVKKGIPIAPQNIDTLQQVKIWQFCAAWKV